MAHDVGDEVADGDGVLAVLLALRILVYVGDLVEGEQDAGKVTHLNGRSMAPSIIWKDKSAKTMTYVRVVLYFTCM